MVEEPASKRSWLLRTWALTLVSVSMIGCTGLAYSLFSDGQVVRGVAASAASGLSMMLFYASAQGISNKIKLSYDLRRNAWPERFDQQTYGELRARRRLGLIGLPVARAMAIVLAGWILSLGFSPIVVMAIVFAAISSISNSHDISSECKSLVVGDIAALSLCDGNTLTGGPQSESVCTEAELQNSHPGQEGLLMNFLLNQSLSGSFPDGTSVDRAGRQVAILRLLQRRDAPRSHVSPQRAILPDKTSGRPHLN